MKDCKHEIVLQTGKKMENPAKGTLDEMLACARCSTVVIGNGDYQRIHHAMAEIYQGKGLYKRYKVYALKEGKNIPKETSANDIAETLLTHAPQDNSMEVRRRQIEAYAEEALRPKEQVYKK